MYFREPTSVGLYDPDKLYDAWNTKETGGVPFHLRAALGRKLQSVLADATDQILRDEQDPGVIQEIRVPKTNIIFFVQLNPVRNVLYLLDIQPHPSQALWTAGEWAGKRR